MANYLVIGGLEMSRYIFKVEVVEGNFDFRGRIRPITCIMIMANPADSSLFTPQADTFLTIFYHLIIDYAREKAEGEPQSPSGAILWHSRGKVLPQLNPFGNHG